MIIDKKRLESKYLNSIDGVKTPTEIRSELIKTAVLENWFSESLSEEIRNTMMRLWDGGIIGLASNHAVYKTLENL